MCWPGLESRLGLSHLAPWDEQSLVDHPWMSCPEMTVSCLPAIVSCLSDNSEHVMEAGQPAPPPGSSPGEAVLPYRQGVVASATTGLDPHHLAGNQTVEGLSASDAQAAEDNPVTLLGSSRHLRASVL